MRSEQFGPRSKSVSDLLFHSLHMEIIVNTNLVGLFNPINCFISRRKIAVRPRTVFVFGVIANLLTPENQGHQKKKKPVGYGTFITHLHSLY